MSDSLSQLALWLADVHLLAGALLAVVLLAMAALRQPAQRMAVAKSTLAALTALVVLCALPGWSLVHLLSAESPSQAVAPVESFAVAPNFMEPARPLPSPVFDTTPAPASPQVVAVAPAAPTPSAPIDWIATALLAHAVGSASVIAWLMIGAVMAGRVRRSSGAAPDGVVNALRSIVGDAAVPELLVSTQVATPVALGLRRPAIILPSALSESGATAGLPSSGRRVPDSHCWTSQQWRPPVELAAILAHEWAHIASGDLRTLAASRWLLAILWPQPLFWLLRRVIRLDQETLADAAAAEVAGRIDYAEQLVAWARDSGPRGRAPRLAGAVGLWEGPSQLKRRIATLLDEKLTVLRAASRRWRIGTACAALTAACLLSLVTLQRQDVVQASTAKVEESVEVDAPDPAGAIMALDLRADRQVAEDYGILNTLSPTWGARGQVVPAPTTVAAAVPDSGDGAFELTEFQNGLRVRLADAGDAATTEAIPLIASGTFALAAAPGTGGGDATAAAAEPSSTHELKIIVVDSEGKPLAGVSIRQNHLYLPADAPPDAEPYGKGTEIKNHNYVTDKDGAAIVTWSGTSVDLRLWVSHPGYVPLHAMWARKFQTDGDQLPTEFTFDLKRGTKIGGYVKNEAGEPVAGAKVTITNVMAMTPIISAKPGTRPQPTPWLAEGDSDIVTDSEGAWAAENIPADADLQSLAGGDESRLRPRYIGVPLRLKVTHPDYATFGGWRSPDVAPTLPELRSGDAVVVMKVKGPNYVEPTAPGWGSPAPTDSQVGVDASDLAAVRGGTVRLHLVDVETGKPLVLPVGARAFVEPARRERPATVQPIVQFSEQGVGEVVVAAGDYNFHILVPGATPTSPQWFSVGYFGDRTAEPRPIEIIYTTIAEGSTTDVTVPMERREAPSASPPVGEVTPAKSR